MLLMRMTPPFWMPALRGQDPPDRQRSAGRIAILRLTAQDDKLQHARSREGLHPATRRNARHM